MKLLLANYHRILLEDFCLFLNHIFYTTNLVLNVLIKSMHVSLPIFEIINYCFRDLHCYTPQFYGDSFLNGSIFQTTSNPRRVLISLAVDIIGGGEERGGNVEELQDQSQNDIKQILD